MAQEQSMPAPRSIFEAINQNVYVVSNDLHKLMDEFYSLRKEVAELRAIFNPPAPEQPIVTPGRESVETE